MAVFLAFSDETEIGRAGGEFFFGGYVGRADEWPWMVRAWQERVLDGPPKIPYLHMREQRDEDWRKQYGMSLNDSEERISEAARIMHSFGNIAAIVSKVRRSDLNDVFYKRYRKRKNVPIGINEPDYLCFIAYAAFMLGQVYRKWPEAERLDFVVSQKKNVSHPIGTFRDSLQHFIKPPLRELVGALIPASMEERIPLQAADALLWHIQRYYATGQNQREMGVSDGIHLAYLIQNGDLDGTIHTWERLELEEMAEKWAAVGLIPKV